MKIRTLRVDEIECRVQQVKEKGCILLLYKDARCDMRILDETFDVDGWERDHVVINGNLFCNVRIWSEKRNCWITKQDVGTESNTEKEKGQASDSFKRACFNIGIGRELYTSPFIWIKLNKNEVKQNGTRYSLDFGVKFKVSEIEYNDKKEIIKLVIVDSSNKVRFTYGSSKRIEKPKEIKVESENEKVENNTSDTIPEFVTAKQLIDIAKSRGYTPEQLCKKYKASEIKFITQEQKKAAYIGFNKMKEVK